MLTNALKQELVQVETPKVTAFIKLPTGCGLSWHGCGNCAK